MVRSVVEIYFFSEGNHDRCEGKKTMWGKTLRKQVNSSFSVIYLQKPAVEAKGSDIVQHLETTYFLIGEETSDASIYFLSRKGLGVRGSKAVLLTRDFVL